ncbi:hypothetical protein HJC99_01595 [Candidatus Saccharibacteria bacterium]|nr:hypothetical protein [Candidatus Saccharibacteria bacterium]
MFNLLKKDKPKKKNLLELPAAKQKKSYKEAADRSIDMQVEVVNKYKNALGEKIERNR